jgi:hypothetical protein
MPLTLGLAGSARAQVPVTQDDGTPPPVQTPAPVPAPPAAAPAPLATPATTAAAAPAENGASVSPAADSASTAPPSDGDGGTGHTLLVAGIVSLAVGYGIALVGGAVATGVGTSQQTQYKGTCLASGPLNFIPLFGPFMYASAYPNHEVIGYGQGSPESFDCQSSMGVSTAIVATSEVLQLGGAALIASSFIFRALTSVPVGQTGRLTLMPGALSAPAGLTLEFSGP